jgi:hypothetical protein
MRKLIFLCFALSLIGGVAYASREKADRTTKPSPLFSRSLTRSIAEMEGRCRIPTRMIKRAAAPAQYYSSDTLCETCGFFPTVAGPTCDWTICPAGCAIGSMGLVTCSGIRCETPTSNEQITCSGDPFCQSTSAPTCNAHTCNSGGSCNPPTSATPDCPSTSSVTCGATVCDNTCTYTCTGTGCGGGQTMWDSTCANQPSCAISCDQTSGPQFTCGGICETSDSSYTCWQFTCGQECGG